MNVLSHGSHQQLFLVLYTTGSHLFNEASLAFRTLQTLGVPRYLCEKKHQIPKTFQAPATQVSRKSYCKFTCSVRAVNNKAG